MSFVVRARKSRERGDTVRAVLTLVAGLRREPDHTEAIELLVETVRDEADPEGVEHEIAQILAGRPDRDILLSEMVAGLKRREITRAADRLVVEGERRGIRYVPPPEPVPVPEPEPEPEPQVDEASQLEDEEDYAPDAEFAPDSDDSDEDAVLPDEAAAAVTRPAEALDDDEVETPAQARARDAVERGRRDRRRKARKRLLVVVLLALAVGGGAIGFVVWQDSQRTGEVSDVEESIAQFNTFSLAEVTFEDAPASLPELSERIAFVRALSAPADVPDTVDWKTAWGWSAAALAATDAGDLEKAIELTTKAERLFPHSVASTWARARLEEERGELVEANAAAQRVIERHPRFTPAHELSARVAARRLEFDDLRAVVQRLVEVDPDHPYKAILSLRTPEQALLGAPGAAQADESDGELQIDAGRSDDFLRAVAAYQRAVSAETRSKPAAVAENAAAAVALDPGFAAAHLVLGAARAAEGAPEAAADIFREAADAGASSSAELRTLIQAAAPLALAGAGRPDLARPFTTPFVRLRAEGVDDELDEQVGESRPQLLRQPALPDARVVPAAIEALYARVEVLRASGEHEAALATLEELDRRGVEPARARATAKILLLESASPSGWDPEIQSEPGQRIVSLAQDYAAGRFGAVAETSLEGLPDWAAIAAFRLQVASLLPQQRVSSALQHLDKAPIGLAHRASLRGLRLRALSRLSRDNAPFEDLYQALETAKPTSVDRLLDLAAGALWQGDIKEAGAWLDEVAKKDAGNREAAWTCGLMFRLRERAEDAAECFQRSGRALETTADLLVELGNLHLGQRRWESARASYQEAFVLAPQNANAARGLGEALSHIPPETAKIELDRLLVGATPDARAELLKWKAIVHGVRKGDDPAFAILQEAAAHLGERDDILMERARWHQAREERSEARALYERAVERNDTLTAAHAEIARIALEEGDAEGAKLHLQRYLEIEPRGPEASWARRKLETK